RTGGDARRAIAAAVGMGDVRLEIEIRYERAEEQPRAEPLVDQAAVLADPADAGLLRPGFLHHRAGVDLAVDARAGAAQPGGQLARRLEDDVVVVAAARVAGDDQFARRRLGVACRGGVRGGQGEHAARAGQDARGIEPLLATLANVVEAGVPALPKPAIEARLLQRMRSGDAAQIETQLEGALLHPRGRGRHGYLFMVMASPSRSGTTVETS